MTKHTENYVGTFSKNVHVAQCWNCHLVNSDLLRRIKKVKDDGKEWDFSESQELSQEWYQRKNMVYIPSQEDRCENGFTKFSSDLWICKECSEIDGYDYEGDYDAWSESFATIDTPTGSSIIIHTKVADQLCNIGTGCLFCYPNTSHSI